ncbi:MAG: NAD(P)/FAD-dependent oxidoreductase [Proteobacteria bacterium]|nr:NAD(P)/FAD-dependent oxidoreductase [Pseudomonadota bacterium]
MDKLRIVVVGAGPAGVRASETLVRSGLRPVVVDEAPQAGGQIYRRQPPGFTRTARALYGFEHTKATQLHRTFDGLGSAIDYHPRSLAWNAHDNVLYTAIDGRVVKHAYDALILATGATDRMYPVPGWTRPGVYTLGGAQVALKYQGCAVGDPIVFMGSSPLLYLVAYQYANAGARVAAVLDTTPFRNKVGAAVPMLAAGSQLAKGVYYMAALAARGIRIEHGITPIEIKGGAIDGADGGAPVETLVYRSANGRTREIACRAVSYGYGIKPEAQLAEIVGCAFRFEPQFRQWLPDVGLEGRVRKGLYLAGDGARVGGADAAEASGALASLALLHDFGIEARGTAATSTLQNRLARAVHFQQAQAGAFATPAAATAALPDDVLVCRCEAITAGDIRKVSGQRLGGREINRVKAFCRVGMGRCQGRFCGHAATEIVAAAIGADIASVGRLRAAGPVKPVPFAIAPTEAV